MRRGFVAVCALAAIGLTAGAAQAAAPEYGRCVKKAGGKFSNSGCTKTVATGGKFEWEPGPGPKPKFISVSGPATFETANGTKIRCKKDRDIGEFINDKQTSEIAIYEECEVVGGGKCETPGAIEGVIEVEFADELVLEKIGAEPALDKVADVSTLKHATEVTCAGLPIQLQGSVMANVPANKMLTTITKKYTALKGEQKPDHAAGGVMDEHTLEASVAGGPFEELGLTTADTVTGEEPLEVSTVN